MAQWLFLKILETEKGIPKCTHQKKPYNLCNIFRNSQMAVQTQRLKRLLIADASALIFRGSTITAKDPQYKGGWSLLSCIIII